MAEAPARGAGAGDGLDHQLVDNGPQRLLGGKATSKLLVMESELPVGTGAAGKYHARVFSLGGAVKVFGILSDQLQEIIEQLRARRDCFTRQANEAALQPMALRPPAVLVEQQQGVVRKASAFDIAPVQRPAQTSKKGSDANRVVNEGTNVSDAQFKRRESRRGAKVPPNLCRVLYDAGAHQRCDRALIVAPARKALRDALAWRRVIDSSPIGLEPGVLAPPERRGCRQREQPRTAFMTAMRRSPSSIPTWTCMPPINMRRPTAWRSSAILL
jgi:hypothetical protein